MLSFYLIKSHFSSWLFDMKAKLFPIIYYCLSNWLSFSNKCEKQTSSSQRNAFQTSFYLLSRSAHPHLPISFPPSFSCLLAPSSLVSSILLCSLLPVFLPHPSLPSLSTQPVSRQCYAFYSSWLKVKFTLVFMQSIYCKGNLNINVMYSTTF